MSTEILNVRVTPWTTRPVTVEPLEPDHYKLAIGQTDCGAWYVVDRVTHIPVGIGKTRQNAIGVAFGKLQQRADEFGTDPLSLLERLRAIELSPVGIGHA